MDRFQTIKGSFKLAEYLLWMLWLVSMCEVCEVKRHTWCNPVWVSLILWLRLRLLCWNCLSILGNLRAGAEKERTIVRQPSGVSRHHVHNERCQPVQIKNTQFPYQCRATSSGLIPCQIFVTMSCRFGLYQFYFEFNNIVYTFIFRFRCGTPQCWTSWIRWWPPPTPGTMPRSGTS